ncbi:MAG: hypothetical protein LBT08_06205, partial [Synergistaceae bacterium]|nr:hypothetical protein [Synergistaceae bacterium]
PLEDFGDDDDIDEDNPDLIEPAVSQDVPYIVSDEPYVPPATTTLSGDELFKKVSVDAFEVTAQTVSSDAAAGKKTSLDLPGASIASADAAPPGISLDISARSTSGDVPGASPDISGRRSVISSDLKQIIHPDANQGEKEGEN